MEKKNYNNTSRRNTRPRRPRGGGRNRENNRRSTGRRINQTDRTQYEKNETNFNENDNDNDNANNNNNNNRNFNFRRPGRRNFRRGLNPKFISDESINRNFNSGKKKSGLKYNERFFTNNELLELEQLEGIHLLEKLNSINYLSDKLDSLKNLKNESFVKLAIRKIIIIINKVINENSGHDFEIRLILDKVFVTTEIFPLLLETELKNIMINIQIYFTENDFKILEDINMMNNLIEIVKYFLNCYELIQSNLPIMSLKMTFDILKIKSKNKSYLKVYQDLCNFEEIYLEKIKKIKDEKIQKEKKVQFKFSEDVPINYFDCPIIPDYSEFTQKLNVGKIQKHIIEGKYPSTKLYLNNIFHLLREDFCSNLKIGVNILYTFGIDNFKNIDKANQEKVLKSVFIYDEAKLVNINFSTTGFFMTLTFRPLFARKIKWGSSKRLVYGSLVVLVDKNFSFLYLATVNNKPNNLDTMYHQTGGYIQADFVLIKQPGNENIPEIVSKMHSEPFYIIECRTYFESYYHFLKRISSLNESNLVFQKYLIDVEKKVDPPKYLGFNSHYNFEPISKKNVFKTSSKVNSSSIRVLQEYWPPHLKGTLDDSQYLALKHMLTKEISLVQGPPGTGKTFVGALAVKILLENQDKWNDKGKTPMLVLCYTNHALDQFLNHILNFTDDIVRVGGRCDDENIKQYSLKNIRMENKIYIEEVKIIKELEEQLIKLNKNIFGRYIFDLNELRKFEEIQHLEENLLYGFFQTYLNEPYLREINEIISKLSEEIKEDIFDLFLTENKFSSNKSKKIIENIFGYLQIKFFPDLTYTLLPDFPLGNNKYYEIEDYKTIMELKEKERIKIEKQLEKERLRIEKEKERIEKERIEKEKEKKRKEKMKENLKKNQYEMIFVPKNSENKIENTNKENEEDKIENKKNDNKNIKPENDFSDYLENPSNEKYIFVQKNVNQYADEPKLIFDEEELEDQDYEYDDEVEDSAFEEDRKLLDEDWEEESNLKNFDLNSFSQNSFCWSEEIELEFEELVYCLSNYQCNMWWINSNAKKLLAYFCKFQINQRENIPLFKELFKKYTKTLERADNKKIVRDLEILRKADVVGMTITGSAKFAEMIELLKSPITIIEEAGEVLECFTVSSLTKYTKHLIMIGDHQQLRPTVEVYKLASKYNFAISLFERLIKNELPFVTLTTQRRMRSDFADFIRLIYDKYEDGENVKEYENIKGVSSNLYFFDHKWLENTKENSTTKINKTEAEMIVKFTKYLIQQGYAADQITIITLYLGQLFEIKNQLRKQQIEKIRGEECDIIIVSLVRSNKEGNLGFSKILNRICVSLSRARKGMYIFGNFFCLQNARKQEDSYDWKRIVALAENKKAIGPELHLICQTHKNGISVRNPEDFKKSVDGGCQLKCDLRLDCGHQWYII